MKTLRNLLKPALLIGAVMCCFYLSACKEISSNPTKPFIIIEKSYGNFEGSKCWRYVYCGQNSVQRKFTETTEKYNIGDSIK